MTAVLRSLGPPVGLVLEVGGGGGVLLVLLAGVLVGQACCVQEAGCAANTPASALCRWNHHPPTHRNTIRAATSSSPRHTVLSCACALCWGRGRRPWTHRTATG